MKVNEELTITMRSTDNAFYGEYRRSTYLIKPDHPQYPMYKKLYEAIRPVPWAQRPAKMRQLVEANAFPGLFGIDANATPDSTVVDATPDNAPDKKELLISAIGKMMDFFTEFSFSPSFRFTNTFAFMAAKGQKYATEYVKNYFALMDSSYALDVMQKMRSTEFKEIIKSFQDYGLPSSHINTRLKVYYGSAGTGKTTIAQAEADNRCIVCNSSMLPSDLMEDFIFKDGNPDFNPSLLWECMEQGKTIVLDEINLLPFDSLRFLQGIVDGKSEFYYKNRPVHINDGFQIIGTMNLSLGGMIYGLPEPLVDRCSETKEFVLTAEQLAKAIVGMDEE